MYAGYGSKTADTYQSKWYCDFVQLKMSNIIIKLVKSPRGLNT